MTVTVVTLQHLQLPLHRSWSISQSLEHLEGHSSIPNPIPSRLHPSNLGPTRSNPIANSHPALQRPSAPPRYIAGYPDSTSADAQQMASSVEVHQQPDSPFSSDDASPSFNLRQMVGQQPQNQHEKISETNNQVQHARPSLGIPNVSSRHASLNQPFDFIPGRSEHDSAVSFEFAGQSLAPSMIGAKQSYQNNADNLLHHPPSMQWRQ